MFGDANTWLLVLGMSSGARNSECLSDRGTRKHPGQGKATYGPVPSLLKMSTLQEHIANGEELTQYGTESSAFRSIPV